MSGKKAGQVTALLRQGANTRSAGDANFARILNDFFSVMQKNEMENNDIVDKINNSVFEISNEAKSECDSECSQLKEQFEKIKASAKKVKYNTNSVKSKKDYYKNEFTKIDNEAERLHSILKYKRDYCDPEYQDARQLLNKTKDLLSSQNRDEQDLILQISLSNQKLSQTNSLMRQLNALKRSIEKLNQKSKDIVELRKKASEAKSFIKNELSAIKENIAKKFLEKEYEGIVFLCNQFSDFNDDKVVREFDHIQNKISLFKNNLAEKYSEFLAKKAKAEKNIEETYALLSKSKYYNPIDYAKKGEDADSIHLFDFLKSYAEGEFVDKIDSSFAKAKSALDQEKFEDVNTIMSSVQPIISEASELAKIKQEEALRSIYWSLDLKDVLASFNYKIDMSLDDGNIKIIASAGDERLEILKSMLKKEGDDESEVLNIDHHESQSGTCQATWSDIRAKAHECGVLIQDVTKNGKSILFNQSSSTAQNIKTQERARG